MLASHGKAPTAAAAVLHHSAAAAASSSVSAAPLPTPMPLPAGFFVAVHAGAGQHAAAKAASYCVAMEAACRTAVDALSRGGDSLDAVEAAIKV